MAQNRYSDTKQSEGATVFGTWSALSKLIPRRFSNAQQSSGPTIGWSPLCTRLGPRYFEFNFDSANQLVICFNIHPSYWIALLGFTSGKMLSKR